MPNRSYWRNLKRIVEPTGQPATVNDLKPQLGLDCFDTSQDKDLQRRLKSAIRFCERYQSRAYCLQTWRMTFDCFEHWEILLPICPVIDVTSVQIINPAGSNQTVSSSLYQVDTYSEPGRIKPAYGQSWPSTRAQTYNAVTITWTAGYATGAVPSSTIDAILMIAADLDINRYAQDETPLNVNQRVYDLLNQERLIWL